MKIRLAKYGDYQQVLGLLRQLNPDDPPDSVLVRDAYDGILASYNLRLLVAEEEGVLLSTCYLNLIPNVTRGGRPYAVIENVVTDAKHRKRGIGKAVMLEAIEQARRANCYKIMLMTGQSDPGVHTFYKSCGFAPDKKQAYLLRLVVTPGRK